MYVVCSVGNSEKCPDGKKYHIPSLETEPILWYLHILSYIPSKYMFIVQTANNTHIAFVNRGSNNCYVRGNNHRHAN